MITYYINIDTDKVNSFEQMMQNLEIDFDKINNIIHIDKDGSVPDLPLRTGSEIPKLITEINNFIKTKYIRTAIPTNYQNWDTLKCYNFLRLAVNEFEWENGKILHSFRALNYSTWPYIANEYSVELLIYT